jgi:hypothetical protein
MKRLLRQEIVRMPSDVKVWRQIGRVINKWAAQCSSSLSMARLKRWVWMTMELRAGVDTLAAQPFAQKAVGSPVDMLS